jgi:hypothetical protein
MGIKIKNVNLSLLILLGLIVLSFSFYVSAQEHSSTNNNIFLDSDQDGLTDDEEKLYGTDPRNSDSDGDSYSDGAEVKAGYDPTKSAPGDKVVSSDSMPSQPQVEAASSEDNLTQQVAQKITEITSKTDSSDQESALDEIKSLVNDSLAKSTEKDSLPEIKKEDIKILKQNYKNLSAEKAKERKKEDFSNYITAIFYILSSNSPQPITSSSDITSISTQLVQNITSALTSRDTSALDDLDKNADKMLEQIKDVEVPEDLVSIHIKALSFAMYAKQLKGSIAPKKDDPLGDITNYSKMEGFISSLMQFSQEAQSKFAEYGLTFDETMQKKLKGLGIEVSKEDQDLLKQASQ